MWPAQSKTHHGIGVVKGENVELRGPFAVCNNLDSWSFGQATLVSYDKETLEWIVHVGLIAHPVFQSYHSSYIHFAFLKPVGSQLGLIGL